MKRALVSILALACLLAGTACVRSQLSSRERLHVELRYANARRHTTVSMFVSPFFRDDTRRLLSLHPPGELELLVTPQGDPIRPGETIEVLPAGTKVTVMTVKFPAGLDGFTRPLMTPRDRTWVELRVDGRPPEPTFVLTLTPDLKTEDEVVAAVNALLTEARVDQEVAALTEAEREMVRTKQLAPGVGPRALELTWGSPNVKRIYGDGSVRVQEWTWRSDLSWRKVVLRDDVVHAVELPEPKVKDAVSKP